MKKVIAKLKKEEVSEIERYFERFNSLKELILVFEADEVFNKKSNMYEKILDDVTQTRKNFDLWWSRNTRIQITLRINSHHCSGST